VILPALFCIDVNPVLVEAREQAGDPTPHADSALALTFVNPHELRVITAAGLFERLHDSRRVESKRGMAAKIHERFQELQRQASEDEQFRRDVRLADSNERAMASSPTRILTRTLVGVLIEDARTNITPNDAIDFLHTAVPVAHCDAVLLDGRWYDYVARARRKLDGRVKMAATFSARDDGINRLLAYLEGGD